MKAFFLAAGFGTRLKPFTETDAKPAIPFLGLPQILYPYYFCKELGINEIVYNTHHNPESVNQVFQTFGIEATNHYEKEILNSGGGLSHARSSLLNEKTFLLLNADSLFIYNKLNLFEAALEKHTQEDRLATLFTIHKDGCGTDFPGLVSNELNTLVGAGLKKDYEKTNPDQALDAKFNHFIGCYIFSNRIFKYLKDQPDNLIYDILLKLPDSEKEKVKTENLTDVTWYELGTIKDYKTNHLSLSKLLDNDADNSFNRTHTYFKNKFPDQYPYKNKLEQQILRSL
jgi:mannose-1-phosphate guanylyltransferase